MTKKLAFHLSSVLVSTDYPFFLSCRNLSRSENQKTVPNPSTSWKLLRFYLMSKVCPNSFAVAYLCEWRLCHRLIHRMLTKLTGLLIYLLGPLAMPRKPYWRKVKKKRKEKEKKKRRQWNEGNCKLYHIIDKNITKYLRRKTWIVSANFLYCLSCFFIK